MAYIGKTPLVGNYQICDALTASATADYTLQVGGVNVSPQSANAMIVSLNSVIQGPGASRGFTVSGSTISFNSALTSSDVIDFIYIFGDVLDIGTPTDDSVSAAKIASNAVTTVKILDDNVTTAKIADNNVTLAKLADGTQGDILYYGASGAPALLGFGTSGDFLKTQGTGANPVWTTVTTSDISWQTVVTGTTLSATAGNGYWIDTTSNACTITLPGSASNGDQIIFADYDRTWGTYGIVIDSNGLNYQGQDDTFDVEYGTDGQAVHIVYSDATNGWIPILDKTVAEAPSKGTPYGIFGFGNTGSATAITNLVTDAGVVGTDVSGVGTARYDLGACEYGGDKGIFGYGTTPVMSTTNLVSNAGVVAADVTGVGQVRQGLTACSYGDDKGIFGFGYTGSGHTAITNLVSNTGVVATDTAGVGTGRNDIASCEYGGDKAIFGYGQTGSVVSMTNLVSSSGVVAADVTGVGTSRKMLGACTYNFGQKGIFAYGTTDVTYVSMSNLVSNVGVVATDVTGVGTSRRQLGATQYNGDKGIFGYGYTGSVSSLTNLVSNVGVIATDVTGVGSARQSPAACSYG